MFGLKRKEEEKPHVVPSSWIERATRAHEFTPDIQELERYTDCLVFLYNEAMEGRRANEAILDGSSYIVPAYTLDTNLSLWNKNLGRASFPIALSGVKRRPRDKFLSSRELSKLRPCDSEDVIPGRIRGELYLIRPALIKRLDEYVLNGVQFQRKRIRVIVPHISRREGCDIKAVHVVRAFFYEGIRDYWLEQLDCGVRYSIFPTRSSEEFKYLKAYYEYQQSDLSPSTVSQMYQL